MRIGFKSLLSVGVEAAHDHTSASNVVRMVRPEGSTAVLSDFDLSISETVEYGFFTRATVFIAVHLSAIGFDEDSEPHWGIGARRDAAVFGCSADMVEEAWAVSSVFADVNDCFISIFLVNGLGRAADSNEAWEDVIKMRLEMRFKVLRNAGESSEGLSRKRGALRASSGDYVRQDSLDFRDQVVWKSAVVLAFLEDLREFS